MYHAFPPSPLIPPLGATTDKTQGIADEQLKVVHEEWLQAFDSLQYLLRHGFCPYFYLVCRTFTVLFW